MQNIYASKNKWIFFFVLGFLFVGFSVAWGHGEGTSIVPAAISVKAGAELEVTVNGLVGTKTATFSLTGMSGKVDLGTFDIAGDDFIQKLNIPSDLPPGTYRLTVEGGEKSAKTVIHVN